MIVSARMETSSLLGQGKSGKIYFGKLFDVVIKAEHMHIL